MKIALFGASGMVGKEILNEALVRGHQVTAIMRNPSKLATHHPYLSVQVGDASDSATVSALTAGYDAVISAIVDRSNVESILPVTQSLIAGIKAAGVKRLIAVGGAGSLEVAPGIALVDTPQFPVEYRPESLAFREVLNLYRVIDPAELAWTMVSPSIVLLPGASKGNFRIGTDQLLFDAEGNCTVTCGDLAVAILDELEHPQFIGKRFTVGY